MAGLVFNKDFYDSSTELDSEDSKVESPEGSKKRGREVSGAETARPFKKQLPKQEDQEIEAEVLLKRANESRLFKVELNYLNDQIKAALEVCSQRVTPENSVALKAKFEVILENSFTKYKEACFPSIEPGFSLEGLHKSSSKALITWSDDRDAFEESLIKKRAEWQALELRIQADLSRISPLERVPMLPSLGVPLVIPVLAPVLMTCPTSRTMRAEKRQKIVANESRKEILQKVFGQAQKVRILRAEKAYLDDQIKGLEHVLDSNVPSQSFAPEFLEMVRLVVGHTMESYYAPSENPLYLEFDFEDSSQFSEKNYRENFDFFNQLAQKPVPSEIEMADLRRKYQDLRDSVLMGVLHEEPQKRLGAEVKVSEGQVVILPVRVSAVFREAHPVVPSLICEEDFDFDAGIEALGAVGF